MEMAGKNPGHFRLDVVIPRVVPANAGIHNHRLSLLKKVSAPVPKRDFAPYGAFAGTTSSVAARPYSPSFFLRWPSVRSRKALSLMKPAASR
jgi:hypothetical protein